MQTSPYFQKEAPELNNEKGIEAAVVPLSVRQPSTPPQRYVLMLLLAFYCNLTPSRTKRIGVATCNLTPSNIVVTKRPRVIEGLSDGFVDPTMLDFSSSSQASTPSSSQQSSERK